MIDAHDSSAHIAASGVVIVGHKRSHSRVSPKHSRVGNGRSQLHAFGKKHLSLLDGDAHIVDFFNGHTAAGGAQHAHIP